MIKIKKNLMNIYDKGFPMLSHMTSKHRNDLDPEQYTEEFVIEVLGYIIRRGQEKEVRDLLSDKKVDRTHGKRLTSYLFNTNSDRGSIHKATQQLVQMERFAGLYCKTFCGD